MADVDDPGRNEPGATAPLTLRATRSGGARLRAAAVITIGLAVVGAGVYGRLDAGPPSPRPTSALPLAVAASPEPSAGDRIGTHGSVPPLPALLPHHPAHTLEPGGDGMIGGPRTAETHLLAVIMLDQDERLLVGITRLDRGASGVYQATIPLVEPRQAMTATLELSLQASGPARNGVARPANRLIARLPIQVDARPFPPGSLSEIAERNAGRPNSLPAGSITVPGFTVLATLLSDGESVDLSIVVAPLPAVGSARRTDPCRQAISPYPRNPPDHSTNC